MSVIPYPHRVQWFRPHREVGVEDAYGRDIYSAAAADLIDILPAWVQEKSSRQQQSFMALGREISTHTVFIDPVALLDGDYFVTVPGGGQLESEKHTILGKRNPDGGIDHLEIDTLLVGNWHSS
jgi:hypothetical protein